MDNKLIKNIKISIWVVMVIISILLCIILLNRENNKDIYVIDNTTKNQTIKNLSIQNTNKYSPEITDNPENYEEFNQELKNSYKIIKNVISRRDYVTISELANRYIYYEKNNNLSMLNSVLAKEYKSKEETNQLTNIQLEEDNYFIIITEMKTAQINDFNYIFIVDGKTRNINDNTTDSFSIIIQINNLENIYRIYPEQFVKENDYNKLRAGERIKIELEEIIGNSNNKFKYKSKTDAEMSEEYFNNYKEILKYYKEEAYSKLNKNYAQKRFNTQESFNQYIKDAKNIINFAKINQYKVNSYSDYTDYICTDQYNNYYIFRQQNGIMNYTVFLDDYTIMLEQDIKYYNELEKIDKAKYNLNKFVKMVNTKDYNSIYNLLDNTFRDNNFNNVEKLKEYLKTNMYDVSSIEIEDYDDETYEYYIFNCEIKNQKNQNESKKMTIIINQGEGTDFTMSFSFN